MTGISSNKTVYPTQTDPLILIADSGSTRTEWGVAHNGKLIRRVVTGGMNPYFQSADDMDRIINLDLKPKLEGCKLHSAFFYGAGCGSPDKQQFTAGRIENSLGVPANVNSDMLGAARALLGRRRGIACILGTGSNSCMYGGEDIIDQVPALGFILGDEGSGASLGKHLVNALFKRKLPRHIASKLLKERELSQAEVLERVYRAPFPNRYLAGFTTFLKENIGEDSIRQLVFNSFKSFFERNVMGYDGCSNEVVCFAGSVAYYFADVLRSAAESFPITLGSIVQNPMEGLAAYHSS
ncbi:MAG: ATPase [Tannerellaceae bacterium]|jgi:N-acetylglucosamine kinase-like BadF-type ATPase|nr:ATPase [Tannerellaceae bacterium]